MSITSIKKRARAGTLDVEHLLKEAIHPGDALADALDALSVELEWGAAVLSEQANPVVPLGAWAKVVSVYCREGYRGLVRLSDDACLATFVIGLLEELKTEDALDALCMAFHGPIGAPCRDNKISLRIASALNLMLSFKPALAVDSIRAAALRAFLCTLYGCADSEAQRATALLALRGIGDESSAGFAVSKRLRSPWQDVPRLVAKHIRKRLAAEAKQHV
jgi:hypothetical protein